MPLCGRERFSGIRWLADALGTHSSSPESPKTSRLTPRAVCLPPGCLCLAGSTSGPSAGSHAPLAAALTTELARLLSIGSLPLLPVPGNAPDDGPAIAFLLASLLASACHTLLWSPAADSGSCLPVLGQSPGTYLLGRPADPSPQSPLSVYQNRPFLLLPASTRLQTRKAFLTRAVPFHSEAHSSNPGWLAKSADGARSCGYFLSAIETDAPGER